MNLQLVAIGVAILSLVWTISWAIWNHRRAKLIRVDCRAAVLSSKDMVFVPDGSNKAIKIKPGELEQWCLSIFVHNVGSTPVGIEYLTVSLKNKPQKIHLKNCWLMVEDKDKLPKVLSAGETWEGFCDYVWLQNQLIYNFGNQNNWHLVVKVWDVYGRPYKNTVVLSKEVFTAIKQSEFPNSLIDKNVAKQRQAKRRRNRD